MIIFIGQNPANCMKVNDEAFANTKSGEVLAEWIKVLNTDEQIIKCFNAAKIKGTPLEKDYDLELAMILGPQVEANFVALGNYASKFLTKNNIEHYKLPHPSKRNRKFNDPDFIKQELVKCKEWLDEH